MDEWTTTERQAWTRRRRAYLAMATQFFPTMATQAPPLYSRIDCVWTGGSKDWLIVVVMVAVVDRSGRHGLLGTNGEWSMPAPLPLPISIINTTHARTPAHTPNTPTILLLPLLSASGSLRAQLPWWALCCCCSRRLCCAVWAIMVDDDGGFPHVVKGDQTRVHLKTTTRQQQHQPPFRKSGKTRGPSSIVANARRTPSGGRLVLAGVKAPSNSSEEGGLLSLSASVSARASLTLA
jgi:hypothetical protein